MRTKWLNVLVLTALLLGLLPFGASAAPAADPPVIVEVEPELRNQIQADGSTGYLIYFREKADLSPAYNMGWEARGQFVMKALQETAERTQRRVRAYLDLQDAEYQAFWIDNVIVVKESSHNTFNALTTAFPEVESLRARRHPMLHEPVDISPLLATLAIEPNLTHVNADDVWGMGYAGQGIVVANIDTGVRYTHNALVNQYRGNLGGGTFDHNYNWWDPYDGTTAPNDFHNHGSHTMGTMVGDDGGANQIGMAPQATWIACQSFEGGGPDVDASLLECGQFMAAPWDLTGANPNAALRPHVVNNSWGDCGQTYDSWYEGVLSAWHAAGIYPVFSNGNASNCSYPSPPGLNTVGNPARSGNVTGVGSSGTSNGAYATHSNWGPTDNPDTVNPRGYPNLKPQVLAPGTNRSAYGTSTDSTYGGMTGTSMSAPHVAGLIALMWSAAPCLIGDYALTETIIEETATPIPYATGNGDEGPGNVPNHATGWGEINALAAVEAAIASCGDSLLIGTVSDSGTSAPIPGAQVEASSSPTETRSTLTNLSGVYTLNLYAGTYTVTVSAFGYQPAAVSGVVVTTGMTTTQDVALDPANWYTVTGVVTDSATGWPLYAKIAIDGFPGAAIWTDPVTGEYSISLPEGVAYTFNVTAWVAGYLPKAVAVGPLTGDAVVDIALDANVVTCNAPGYVMSGGLNQGFDDATFPPTGWVAYNLDSGATQWVRSTALSRSAPASAQHLYSTTPATGQDGWLRFPQITLGATPVLRFWENVDWASYYTRHSLMVCTADCDTPPTNYTEITHYPSPVEDTWAERTTDLSLYAGQSVYLAFRYTGYNGATWYIDNVAITGACAVPTDGGLVVGNVYDFETGDPLVGALVENAAGEAMTAQATPDDPAVDDGFYTLFSPSGAQAFTATMALYGPDDATVMVVDGDTVRQDFYLPVGNLVVDPAALHATVDLGATEMLSLTLENIGSGAASWEITEKDRGWNPVLLSIPAFTGQLPESAVPTSFTHAPKSDSASAREMAETISLLAGAPAYAVNLNAKALVRIPDVDVPGTWTTIATFAAGDFYAGDFAGADFSQLYLINNAAMQLVSANTATGALTVIGACNPVAGQTWTGMAWDSTTDTMYASATDGSNSTLFTLNLATGAATQVGTVTGAPLLIDIAVNGDGQMYGVDIGSDVLVQINKTTGAATTVGALGVNANYAQGMDFEEDSGVLYWAAYTTSGELRVIDTTTGASALVGAFSGGAEVDSFAFATGGGGDVPWLSESPITGTVAAGGSQIVDVIFDAGVPEITQPGDYYAELRVKNDTPYGALVIPITMTVVPPVDYGKLMGTVTSLGYCDANPAPIEGAEVHVADGLGGAWMVATDAAGSYELWLDAADSPFTVTVAFPVHESGEVTGVAITGQVTTTLDFDLRWLQPCVSADPAALDVTLDLGAQHTETVELLNTGAVATDFGLREKDQGFMPTAIGGPDAFGYRFADSNEADGPEYQWIDISATGTAITGLTDDNAVGPFNLGFDFPFYGDLQTQFYVGSNGALSFGAGMTSLTNQCPLPSTSTPHNLIALLWDDLNFNTSGTVHYQTFTACPYAAGNCTIVQFNNVAHFGGAAGSAGTWQAILFANGNILIQFQDSGVETGSSSTTGIENATGTSGLTYPSSTSCNVAGSIQDAVAVCFAYPGEEPDCQPADVPWLSEDPITGTLAADTGSLLVDVVFDAAQVSVPGRYRAELRVNSDDPTSPFIIPITMTVTAPGWAKVEGVVTGLGHCDEHPAPLEGVDVLIESSGGMTWTRVTDASGWYALYLDPVYAPLTVTVAPAGHEPGEATVAALAADETVYVNFDVRSLEPCASATPMGLSVELISGESDTLPLTLHNAGAGAMSFQVMEQASTLLLAPPLINVLLLTPDTGVGDISLIQTTLAGFSDLNVTTWNVADGDPTAGELAAYDVVIVGNDYTWASEGMTAAGVGNALADYIDAGGKVIDTMFVQSYDNWALAGRYITDGYSAFTVATQDFDAPPYTLGTIYDPNHPIMQGVTAITDNPTIGYSHQDVGLAAGATLLADWNDGEIAVAFNDNVVGVNQMWYHGSSWTGNVPELMHNAIVFLAGGAPTSDVPWLSEDPITGTVPADNARVVDVTFTALPTMTVGTYHATLAIQTNDPLAGPSGKINVPVTMTVIMPVYNLTLAMDGNGAGTITPTVGVYPVTHGEWMTLTCAAHTGSHFAGWWGDMESGDVTVSFEMLHDMTITATFMLDIAPALAITKTVEPEVGLNLGGTVTYTLMLANTGNAAAEGVLLTDTLPAGVSFGAFVSADGATYDAGVISWGGVLSATDTVEIIFTAIVSSNPMYSEMAITNRVDYTSTNAGAGFDTATFQIKRHYTIYLPLVMKDYTGVAR